MFQIRFYSTFLRNESKCFLLEKNLSTFQKKILLDIYISKFIQAIQIDSSKINLILHFNLKIKKKKDIQITIFNVKFMRFNNKPH